MNGATQTKPGNEMRLVTKRIISEGEDGAGLLNTNDYHLSNFDFLPPTPYF